jgi:hypothetical protein
MRCEDCHRTRAGGEPGWILVILHPGSTGAGLVGLHYCPDHATQFDTADQDVWPVDHQS